MKSAGHIAEKASSRLVGTSHFSLSEKHAVYFACGCRLPSAFGKVFFFDESYLEVREADSVYVVSEARGRERVRTMSGGVVRSFLVGFVTGQAVSSQFFLTA